MSKIKLTPFEKKYKERINTAALFGTTEEDFYPLSDQDIRRHCNELKELLLIPDKTDSELEREINRFIKEDLPDYGPWLLLFARHFYKLGQKRQ